MTGNINKLLDMLDDMMIVKGVPIFLTPWIIVHHERVVELLDKIRASVPGEIQEANAIIKRRDDIHLDAQKKANQLLMEAKQQAEILLSDSELLRAVQAEAERIRQQVISDCEILKRQAQEETEYLRTNAITEATAIRDGADKYAETILSGLDRDLSELHDIVRNGQKYLSKIKTESGVNMAAQRSRAKSLSNQ